MPKRKPAAHFAKQAQEAYELSIAGYSYRQIAEEMGVSLATVQRRLELYIKDRTMPKADEYRTRQISRLEVYIRSLWSQINNGDPKAIAAAVRTEERIAKLMGTDSAQLFKVEATAVSRESDANDAQKMLDQFFGANPDERRTRPVIKGEIVTTNGHTRPRRPLKKSEPFRYAAPATEPDEFAAEPDATEEFLEEFEPVKADPANFRNKGRRTPQNPAHRFLTDSDD